MVSERSSIFLFQFDLSAEHEGYTAQLRHTLVYARPRRYNLHAPRTSWAPTRANQTNPLSTSFGDVGSIGYFIQSPLHDLTI